MRPLLLPILLVLVSLAAAPRAEAKAWDFLNTSRSSDKWLRSQILAGNEQEALIQWDDKISGTPLAQSETGKALLGYLLARSGLEVSGLKYLSQNVDFNRVHRDLRAQLSDVYPLSSPAWEVLAEIKTRTSWSSGWVDPKVVQVAMKGPSFKIKNNAEARTYTKVLARLQEGHQKAMILYPLALYALVSDNFRVAEDMLAELELLEQNTIPKDRIYLARARALFQEKRFQEALGYYNRIGQGSDYWLTSQEERAWTHLHLKSPDKSLSLLHSSRAPIFHPISHAEPYSLAAYIFLKLCDYREVFKVIKDFRAAFGDKLALLQNVRDGKSDAGTLATLQKWGAGNLDWKAVGSEVNGLPLLFYRDDEVLTAMNKWWLPQKEMSIVQNLIGKAAPKGLLVGQLMEIKSALRPLQTNQFQAQQLKSALARIKSLATSEVQQIGSVIQQLHVMEAESAQRLYAYAQVDPNLKGEFVDGRVPEGDILVFPANNNELWLDEIDSHRYKVRGCETSKELKS